MSGVLDVDSVVQSDFSVNLAV